MVPAEGNINLQTLICVLAARLRRCPTLSSDKAKWQLIPATLCGRRHCFLADQLWFKTRIREEAHQHKKAV